MSIGHGYLWDRFALYIDLGFGRRLTQRQTSPPQIVTRGLLRFRWWCLTRTNTTRFTSNVVIWIVSTVAGWRADLTGSSSLGTPHYIFRVPSLAWCIVITLIVAHLIVSTYSTTVPWLGAAIQTLTVKVCCCKFILSTGKLSIVKMRELDPYLYRDE